AAAPAQSVPTRLRPHLAQGRPILLRLCACARDQNCWRPSGSRSAHCGRQSNPVPAALQKRRVTVLRIRVVRGQVRKYTDPPHAVRLLRTRRERPRRRAAEKRDERAALHSITSSARASSVGGTSRPSAFAVLRLTTSSYLVGACTGRSAGFSPLRIRSTYWAAERNWLAR